MTFIVDPILLGYLPELDWLDLAQRKQLKKLPNSSHETSFGVVLLVFSLDTYPNCTASQLLATFSEARKVTFL